MKLQTKSQTRSGSPSGRRRGFSLFELTIVVLVIGVIAAIFVPAVGTNLRSSRLSTAANVLASDIEYCQSECITRPSAPRSIIFDTINEKYTLQDNNGAVISHPADSLPFINDFATGRNAQLSGVTLVSIVVGAGTMNVLTFDAYGRPVITADMAIKLQYGTSTMTITVKKGTGEVAIASP
jgi:prepilin-type N-terminal cleavage/methylation domain-containing protein